MAMNYQRDGYMAMHNQAGGPNYFPNSFSGPKESAEVREHTFKVTGDIDRYSPQNEDDYGQATNFWRNVLDESAKIRLVENMAGNLEKASNFIIERVVRNLSNVDTDLSKRLIEELRKYGKIIDASGKK